MKVNIDKTKLIKMAGYACTLAGAAIGMFVTDKEKKVEIEKAVEKHLNNK